MKHHFGDMLDRSGGHWTVVPNIERYSYQLRELSSEQKLISIATISGGDKNWDVIGTFPHLEELTLHSPSQDQLAFVSTLWRLKRLRITHARPKDVGFMSRLQNLEEVVLEYVSGFNDLSPIGELKKLRALHIENLRRVSDFSGLWGATALRYLGLYGTVDWSQPIESFDFLSSLTRLEYLLLHFIKAPKTDQPLNSVRKLPNLQKLSISMNAFPLEVFAWIEANFPHVEGAVRPTCVKFGGNNEEIHQRDIRFRMPVEEFNRLPSLFVGTDGRRYQKVPYQAALLGRGQRGLSGLKDKVDKACELHDRTYRLLVNKFLEN